MNEETPKKPVSWRQLLKLLRPSLALAIVAVVNVVGGLLSGAGDPFFLKLLIDSLGTGNSRLFVILALSLLGVYTAVRVLSYVSALLTIRIKNDITRSMTLRMFDRFFRLPYIRVAEKEDGYYISRVYDEPGKLTSVVDLVVGFMTALAVFIGGLAVCLWIAWEMSLVLFVIGPCLLFLARRFSSGIRKRTETEVEDEARLREGLGRTIRSYRTVRLFELQEAVNGRVQTLLDSYLTSFFERFRLGALFSMLSSILLSYAEMAVMLGVGFLVLKGQVTIGGMFGFINAYWRVVNGFQSLTALAPQYAKLQTHLARVLEVDREASESEPRPAAVAGYVDLNRVSFAYGEEPILEDLSLRLGKGDRVLVVGPNGSGKSTLANVVTGFLEPSTGQRALPPWEGVSGLLLPFEFVPGTAKDNIQIDRLDEAGKEYLSELVHDFGLESLLDQDPARFSEGEKRKLQVCMALLKKADVYIFDEPLSSVEVDRWEVIMDHIFRRAEGSGLMVIMHGGERFRPRFDRVVLLQGQSSQGDRAQPAPA